MSYRDFWCSALTSLWVCNLPSRVCARSLPRTGAELMRGLFATFPLFASLKSKARQAFFSTSSPLSTSAQLPRDADGDFATLSTAAPLNTQEGINWGQKTHLLNTARWSPLGSSRLQVRVPQTRFVLPSTVQPPFSQTGRKGAKQSSALPPFLHHPLT